MKSVGADKGCGVLALQGSKSRGLILFKGGSECAGYNAGLQGWLGDCVLGVASNQVILNLTLERYDAAILIRVYRSLLLAIRPLSTRIPGCVWKVAQHSHNYLSEPKY